MNDAAKLVLLAAGRLLVIYLVVMAAVVTAMFGFEWAACDREARDLSVEYTYSVWKGCTFTHYRDPGSRDED